jgi:hypothetical protein
VIPPDDDSKQAAPGCDVDLKTRAIRFLGCKDQEAMIRAAENRAALVTSQLDARSGLTNRERRALSNERNILRRWLEPKASLKIDHRPLNNIRKQLSVTPTRRRKPSKRRARDARRWNREQNLQRRPDYDPCVVNMEQLEQIQQLRGVKEAKQSWFERKHRKEVNETACRDVTTEAGAVCAGTALVAG